MIPGQIILTTLPQSNGVYKPRPALILKVMPPYGDLLLCGISSQLHHHVRDLDEIIERDHHDFKASNLQRPSLIRAGWLQTSTIEDVQGNIGAISPERLGRLLQKLSHFLIS